VNYADVAARRGGTGKFVVLRKDDDAMLVLATLDDCDQHMDIVRRFQFETGASSFDWRVRGGGWWRYDAEAGEVRLYGSSARYGAFDVADLSGLSDGDVFPAARTVVAGQ